MKKLLTAVLSIIIFGSFMGCSDENKNDSKPVVSNELPTSESSENTEIKSVVQEVAKSYKDALTETEQNEAQKVAEQYYGKETVWKAESIKITADDNPLYKNEGIEGEYEPGNIIIFDVVAVLKGEKGNRTISIARNRDNVWEVINEGF